ncbi:uncharacterized protein LOC111346580 isoform X2 [Stylophora pistillata]|uniref:uncharacterized protein LOC111346580 isoform X2 n=1 Tax=Stylophora pistillata TaxID=50429 RepID=UPI000C03CB79|nr:uncharacterized protein LOC111346580 isoform X2 [Stylophora pistillata]
MATTLHLPAISRALVAHEFPKVWEHRKNLSHWSKQDVPSLKLAQQLDTDHWAKLKGKHVNFLNRMSDTLSSKEVLAGHSQKDPELSSAFQRYYYDQSRHREELSKKTYTMYYQGKPLEKAESSRQVLQQTNDLPRPQVQRRPSVYNQRAKEGFKFWLESDPMIKRISFCSKYTFGSKSTFHGLGNAPRN